MRQSLIYYTLPAVFLAMLILAGCGSGAPSNVDARRAIEQKIDEEAEGRIELVSFSVTERLPREYTYTIEFECTLAVVDHAYLIPRRFADGLLDTSAPASPERYIEHRFIEGERTHVHGAIRYEKTESGWRPDTVSVTQIERVYPDLLLGRWFAVDPFEHKEVGVEFFDNGDFIVTVREDSGTLQSSVGRYWFNYEQETVETAASVRTSIFSSGTIHARAIEFRIDDNRLILTSRYGEAEQKYIAAETQSIEEMFEEAERSEADRPAQIRRGPDIQDAVEISKGIQLIVSSINDLPGTLTHSEHYLTEGRGVFSRVGKRPSRRHRLLGIMEPDGARIVQVDVSITSPANIFGDIRSRVGVDVPVLLVDANNQTYNPIGYIHEHREGVTVMLDPAREIAMVKELPTLPPGGMERLRLVYRVPQGITIIGLRYGTTTVGRCNLEMSPQGGQR